MVSSYEQILAVEQRWADLLHPSKRLPNWILVDFFNTTTPTPGEPSRTLLPNPHEGLIQAVQKVNRARVRRWKTKMKMKRTAQLASVLSNNDDGLFPSTMPSIKQSTNVTVLI